MALSNTSVLMEEWASKNGYCWCLCPQGQLHSPPTSPRGAPRLVGESDPGSCQITASVIGHRACEIFCVLFKSGVSISHSPLAFLKVSTAGFQSQLFGGFCWYRNPRQGSSLMSSDPLLLREKLCNRNYPPICGSPTWEYKSWLYCDFTPPTHLIVVPSL